ncbi:MAG: NADH-quinone oxidoreductase subunit C [Pelagibacteraceae bacterium]|nr:NADH-quinone oxidoreductase subunit C [Pelagibacteraceae bacterium]|tara:strand:+ start:1008 stop:1598 length:591 start_codon:yes stop_codon:yes gene_type:complete
MLQELKKILNDKEIFIKKNYIELVIKNKKDILSIFTDLKQNKLLLFDQLIDITAIDHPSQNLRFELIYILLSMTKNKRLILKTNLKEGDGIDSISKIYKSANWYERECYDLFGIEFFNHPDLRRIMTDYNFEGHPLRKDFPLTGHTEVRYDELAKKVIYEPVKLSQEYRNFDYTSPWEGIPNSLIRDEKSKEKNDE